MRNSLKNCVWIWKIEIKLKELISSWIIFWLYISVQFLVAKLICLLPSYYRKKKKLCSYYVAYEQLISRHVFTNFRIISISLFKCLYWCRSKLIKQINLQLIFRVAFWSCSIGYPHDLHSYFRHIGICLVSDGWSILAGDERLPHWYVIILLNLELFKLSLYLESVHPIDEILTKFLVSFRPATFYSWFRLWQ